MATLTIIEAGGGCLPGTLKCVCGAEALAIWEPKLGARCSGCGRCFVNASAKPIMGAGVYRMVPGPTLEALIDVGPDPRPRRLRPV